jgi:hypothetical protein
MPMLKLLRIAFALILLAGGVAGLLWFAMCAIGVANLGGGSPSIVDYLLIAVVLLPPVALCIGVIVWACRLLRGQ